MELNWKVFLTKLFKIYFLYTRSEYLSDILRNLNTQWLSKYFSYDIDYHYMVLYRDLVTHIADFDYGFQKFVPRKKFFGGGEKQKIYRYMGVIRFDIGCESISMDRIERLNSKIKEFEIKKIYYQYNFSFLKFRICPMCDKIDRFFLDYTLWTDK